MKTLQDQGNDEDQEDLNTMKESLKHLLENIQAFDNRFRKLQVLLIASRGRVFVGIEKGFHNHL